MENRDELLFILSSSDRVETLSLLKVEKLRLSQLSKKLGITIQEASRQLARLQDAQLVERNAQGLFMLSSLGRAVLDLLPSFEFLVENREYLIGHELSFIPPHLRERIGELAGCEIGRSLGDVLKHFQEVMTESNNHIWLMADQILLPDSIGERLARSPELSMRILVPKSVMREYETSDLGRDITGNVQIGLIESVHVGLALNERIAGLILPDRFGKVDFNGGLRVSSPLSVKWCEDLFLSYWNESRVSSL